ncbi:MAG: hypothetical protein PHQ01_02000 [Candidatus Pacebacteria bacterium]|nr:hypothetical protein [Candidatus Paceibacterota bacterium]
MKAKRFKRIDVDQIINDFDNTVIDKALREGSVAYNERLPSLVHSAAEILTCWVSRRKVVLRKSQLFQLWKKIARKTMGENYFDKGEYPVYSKTAGDKLYQYVKIHSS